MLRSVNARHVVFIAAATVVISACGLLPGQRVTEVETTPEPATGAVIAGFLATQAGQDLAPLFQLRDGHVDIRIMDGALYAFTTIDDEDTAVAEKVCDALMSSMNGPTGPLVPVAAVVGASDRTLTTCHP
jgi:hypothetical protein